LFYLYCFIYIVLFITQLLDILLLTTTACNVFEVFILSLPTYIGPPGNSFDVNGTNTNFAWTLNPSSLTIGTNSTFDATTYLGNLTTPSPLPVTFSVKVEVNGCVQNHSILVDRIYCDIQRGISPNSDTQNDFFDLRLMNVQQLEIFNRYGTKVYSKMDYTNEWIGQSNAGDELPDGTYYYVIEFKNNQPSKTGWIYINRDSK
jgi:gliding motility-associated-like protein